MKFWTKNDFEGLLINERFNSVCKELYGPNADVDYQASRYLKLYYEHSKSYSEALVFSSPGRIEVCGNHTDHNNGKVLCASISVDTLAIVTPIEENIVTVASEGYPSVNVNIDDLMEHLNEQGTSEALVRGVAAYFKQNGYNIGGFYATTSSNVFKGAGVSSSASFEVLIAEIFNVVYNESKIDAVTKAKASHYAESAYFGKPCGLMDQSAIALGGVSYIDFEDTENPKIEKINWGLNLDILLCNCGGDHCNLTGEYAAIRSDMEIVAMALGAKTLRFVGERKFERNLPKLQTQLTGRQILRAMHFFEENKRVEKAVNAIKSDNAAVFKKCINESGASSYDKLQNCYVNTDMAQRIPLALGIIGGGYGACACRVHGGGFAGTIIAFASQRAIAVARKRLLPVFGDKNIHVINIRNSGTCEVTLD